jgi:hypothetical protein
VKRSWTIYIAQDKHLDYNWCGATPEIETRMAALVDYYLDRAEAAEDRWNLDSTLWVEVYRRQRGEAGAARLLAAIREGRIGYAANHSVLLWGLLGTELAIRALYGALPVEEATGRPTPTVLVMENHGLPWGLASVFSAAGYPYVGRGTYTLRAETYAAERDPYPLFWWESPGGERVLVRWPPYVDTGKWGGYAEAFELIRLAGEQWDAYHLLDGIEPVSDEVYQGQVDYISETIAHYEAFGDDYPISSILLLGTGWDNWRRTAAYADFIARFNAESDGSVRLVNARYEDFFDVAQREIDERHLDLPTLKGTFGICWDEWVAHLAGPTAEFREAERLLRRAEASYALTSTRRAVDPRDLAALRQGFDALLRFAEHDFGGTDRARAALSAGVRAGAAAEAIAVGRALSPTPYGIPWPILDKCEASSFDFAWRGGTVRFDPERAVVVSLLDQRGREWIPEDGMGLGEFVTTRYAMEPQPTAVFPDALPLEAHTRVEHVTCRRGVEGIAVHSEGSRWEFRWATHWFFHADHDWIDIRYDLEEGWSEEPQAVRFCFPLALADAVYRYDTMGAIPIAGPAAEGGHDLPGANPALYAAQTFAAAWGTDRGALLLIPDAPLVQFGMEVDRTVFNPRVEQPANASSRAAIASVPMLNLTRNDWQFAQGGARCWTFRYRLILQNGPFDALGALREAQAFAVPPYLQVPGEAPTVPGLSEWQIDFSGGPVVALKTAEDGRRLVLRLWNVLEQPVSGSFVLPEGFERIEVCDALERALSEAAIHDGRAYFTVQGHRIATLALSPGPIEP